MDDEYFDEAYDAHGQDPYPVEYYEPEYESHDEQPRYDRYLDEHYDRRASRAAPLDAFDRELLRQPHDDRTHQAARGQARLSLPSTTSRTEYEDEYVQPQSRPQRSNLSQFAYNPPQGGHAMSSDRALPSSPAYRASQRRIEPSFTQNQGPPRDYAASQTRPQQRRRDSGEEGERQYERAQAEAFQPSYQTPGLKPLDLLHPPQMVQGIDPVSTHALPDRFRSIFKFPVFNAVQSRCFETVYKSNDNFVLSSPTGSGKTVILELAICRLVHSFRNEDFKIIYQAPTKSLCSERQRDWQTKFAPLGLQCAELTGDTEGSQLRSVQQAHIILTTPEKWDSITRKWKDHEKLVRMIRLVLIDEVHILKEDRGATLEAVVSRMKSVGSDVRFIALSATVPNSDDIAMWLGKDPAHQDMPAKRERFGEEFRPVKLEKHVVGYSANGNDFALEKILDAKLPDVIRKFSRKKPIMVFCATRAATVNTAKLLANWWATVGPMERCWEAPRGVTKVIDRELQTCISSAVAFHHAGIGISDRQAIESGYLNREINVICCTSTLAVGVNLPCHLVIIKNTITWAGNQIKEYADLEIMQMLGRAGRPQFDDSAVAVIMTRAEKQRHYDNMVSGQEILESCLHLNLIEHLNAEIGLGTIRNVHTAKRWLAGTFLAVRMKENPNHYKLEGDTGGGNLDERLEHVCGRGITQLQEHSLVVADPRLKCTEFGDAMARYYLSFNTMKIILGLPEKAKPSEILSAIAQAAEFREVRFRAGDKPIYKELNKSPSIKFSIPVNLDLPAHKASLIIQSVLGGIDIPANEKSNKVRMQYQTDIMIIWQHINRIIRCIIDCQLKLGDSISVRNGLMLARSLAAKVWDDSPLQMKQIEGIGIVAVRKLVNAGIRSIEALENSEPHRIETVLSRHPPYGMKLLDKLKEFPKPRIALQMKGQPRVEHGKGVKVNVRAEIGFLNEKPPAVFAKKAVYLCMLAETSDGKVLHFCRVSAQHIGKGKDVLFEAILESPQQSIICSIMCDEICGTLQDATLAPKVPASMFPSRKDKANALGIKAPPTSLGDKPSMNTSRRRSEPPSRSSEDFGDEDIDDSDLLQAGNVSDLDFTHIDDVFNSTSEKTRKNTTVNMKRRDSNQKNLKPGNNKPYEPVRLENGNWACNHKCKDKTKCKHMCCKEGVEKRPPPPRNTQASKDKNSSSQAPGKGKKQSTGSQKTQSKLNLPVRKRDEDTSKASLSDIPEIDMTDALYDRELFASQALSQYNSLHRLHSNVAKKAARTVTHKKPPYSYAKGEAPQLSFLPKKDREQERNVFSDDTDSWMSGIDASGNTAQDNHMATIMSGPEPEEHKILGRSADAYGEDDSDLNAAMVGLADFQDMHGTAGKASFAVEDRMRIDQDEFRHYEDDAESIYRDPTPPATKRPPAPIAQLITNSKPFFVHANSSSPTAVTKDNATVSFKRASELLDPEQLAEVSSQSKKRKTADIVSDTTSIIILGDTPKETEKETLTTTAASDKDNITQTKSTLEDIDAWIWKEFGDVVDFV